LFFNILVESAKTLIHMLMNALGFHTTHTRTPFYMLIFWLPIGLSVGLMNDIKLVKILKWSWLEVKKTFLPNIFIGLLIGIFIWLILGLINGLRSKTGYYFYLFNERELFSGLSYGLFFGVLFCLISGFRGFEIQQSEKSNQGIFNSAQNAITMLLPTFLISLLLYKLIPFQRVYRHPPLAASARAALDYTNLMLSRELAGVLFFGIIGGILSAMYLGGNASFRHIVLRFMLYRNGYVPWNYTCFLDCATERLFLQKVGGGYIFVHRMLLEHFAELSPEQEDR
jgi:hypothetical protein